MNKQKSKSIENLNYTFIEDQTLTGITGAWNLGMNIAIASGSDIINNCNITVINNKEIESKVIELNNVSQEELDFTKSSKSPKIKDSKKIAQKNVKKTTVNTKNKTKKKKTVKNTKVKSKK